MIDETAVLRDNIERAKDIAEDAREMLTKLHTIVPSAGEMLGLAVVAEQIVTSLTAMTERRSASEKAYQEVMDKIENLRLAYLCPMSSHDKEVEELLAVFVRLTSREEKTTDEKRNDMERAEAALSDRVIKSPSLADQEVIEAAKDHVALWKQQKIDGLPRSERNAALEETRERLIASVARLTQGGGG